MSTTEPETAAAFGPAGASSLARSLMCAMAALLLIAGCGRSTDEAADVNGVWSVAGNGVDAEVTYRDDGTYTIAPIVDGVPLTRFDLGTYVVEGDTLIFTSNAAAVGCRQGDEGRYEMVIGDPGSWTLNLLEDQCVKRSEGGPFVHTSRG